MWLDALMRWKKNPAILDTVKTAGFLGLLKLSSLFPCQPMKRATFLLLILAAAGIVALLLLPPIPQPLWYHDFADQRLLLGIPNFWNVVSNLPFLFVGVLGLWRIASKRSVDRWQDSSQRWMYFLFFAMVTLTGVGSAYYHLDPDNERLVWDRLPIAMTFLALFAIIMTEQLSRRAGTFLFVPLILLGAATVYYWHLTEIEGKGDLRPYLLTQIYPFVAIPVILWFCPPAYSRTENLYSAMAWYAGAKLYEFLDKSVFSFGQIISGHTLKHIAAAFSCYMIWRWIRERRVLKVPASKASVAILQ